MQTILVHWVEMRKYELPDDAPTDDETKLHEWVDNDPEADGDLEYFAVKRDSRDWEIVDIEKEPT